MNGPRNGFWRLQFETMWGAARGVWGWVVGHERVTVSLVLVAALGTWLFWSVAGDVFAGTTAALDESLLLALRTAEDPTDPIGPHWVEETARDATSLGGILALALFTAAMAGYLFFKREAWVAVFVVAAIGSGVAVSTVMKSQFDRPRPALVPHETAIYTKSFPSGHSAMSSLVYLTLGAVMAREERTAAARVFLVAVAVLLTGLVGASRVYLGVHWPTDVAAGWALGVSWAAAAWLVFRWLERRLGRADD